MSVIGAVPDATISTFLATVYLDYSGGVAERPVMCPMRCFPCGNPYLGGFTQLQIMNSPIPVGNLTIVAHGGFAR
jgi:hypothetical protein